MRLCGSRTHSAIINFGVCPTSIDIINTYDRNHIDMDVFPLPQPTLIETKSLPFFSEISLKAPLIYKNKRNVSDYQYMKRETEVTRNRFFKYQETSFHKMGETKVS